MTLENISISETGMEWPVMTVFANSLRASREIIKHLTAENKPLEVAYLLEMTPETIETLGFKYLFVKKQYILLLQI